MHEEVNLPNGDILIHSGDCTNIGEENDVREFITWFQNIQRLRLEAKQKHL